MKCFISRIGVSTVLTASFAMFITNAAVADGLDNDYDDTPVCDVHLKTYEEYREQVHGMDPMVAYGMYRGLATYNCGSPPIWQDWRDRGFSDQDLVGFLLGGGGSGSGTDTPVIPLIPIAPVPIGATVWMLACGLIMLFMKGFRRGKET